MEPQGEQRQEENVPATQSSPAGREGGTSSAAQPGGQTVPAQDNESGGAAVSSAAVYPDTAPTLTASDVPIVAVEQPGTATQPPAGRNLPPAESAQPPADAPSSEAPSLDEKLPCEDARWLALVEAVKSSRRKLAADLRRVEVTAIGEGEVRIAPPESGVEIGGAELEFLGPPLAEAFGAAFQLRIDHDSNRKARHGYSLIGREKQIEEARLSAEREAAIGDEKVQRVMRAFPQGKVEEVAHPEAPRNRRNDV